MTVYSELLNIALIEEQDETSDVAGLVAQTLRRRAELETAVRARPADPSSAFSYSLAYDAALVRLCRKVGVEETLTAGAMAVVARQEAEKRLVERLPSIAAALTEPLA